MTSDPRDLLHRALKALPAPRAPGTLLPRVMAAAEARRRQTGPRPWFTWPVEWRAAAAVPGSTAAAHLAAVAWEMVVQPALGYVLVWIVVMCAVSVAIGAAFSAALGRVALGEASQ